MSRRAVVTILFGLLSVAIIQHVAWGDFLNAPNKTVAQINREKSIASGIPESQLGPSGLPKIHTPAHASIKEAKEAARRRVEREKVSDTLNED